VQGDDQSVPNNNLTAVQSLVEQDKVFALAVVSPFFFSSYRYTVQKGVPVASAAIDGPEYGDPNNTNLFSAQGSFDSQYRAGDAKGKYFKSKGVTVLGSIAYGDSPSATGTAKSGAVSAEKQGIKTVVNTTIKFGSTDFTAAALQFKQAGINGLITSMVLSSNIAVVKALKEQGVQLKGSMVYGGYTQEVLDQADANATLQGIGLTSGTQPTYIDNDASKTILSALKQYAGYDKPNPTEGQLFGWYAADLMVRGLQEAGQSPTRKTFIDNLRKVKDYTMGGLLGAPVDFSQFSNVEQSTSANCMWINVVQGKSYVADPADQKPICNTELIPGTAQA
jgi:branched-chain amino acid transport system substrate-binding protein